MYKLFTLEEATQLIPVVDQHLGDMQVAVTDMLRLRQGLQDQEAFSVTARNSVQEISFLLGVIHDSKAELDRLGVHLKDVESGLVDFPSQLGAEVICLTWEKGQDAITHYHRLAGDTAPRPLPEILAGATPPAVTAEA